MRVRLSERQLGLIKEEEKKASVYERFLSHKIIPYIMEKIEQENYDNEDIYGHTVVDLVQEIEDTFGLSYHLASFAVFTWLLRDGTDPEEHWYLADWLYKSPDPMGYLKHSGYYDEYIKDISFNDIDKTEDGKVIFSVDNWEEFADLFDSPDMVRGILGEDYYELYNYYDYPMTDITESLSDENIKYIIDYIIENYNGQSIGDLSHRNEFEEIINEDGELIVDERLKTILIDGYNLVMYIISLKRKSESPIVLLPIFCYWLGIFLLYFLKIGWWAIISMVVLSLFLHAFPLFIFPFFTRLVWNKLNGKKLFDMRPRPTELW